MARKIKPQRTQRNAESCYFSLSPPLCSLCPLWFSETLNRKYQKVSDVLVAATQDTRDPKKLPFGSGLAIYVFVNKKRKKKRSVWNLLFL